MRQYITKSRIAATIEALFLKYKDAPDCRERIIIGVNQVADFWRKADGSPQDFHGFCLDHFIAGDEDLELLFNRFQNNLEQLGGHFHELSLFWDAPMQDERHQKTPADRLFAAYEPGAHFSDDCFQTKIAFTALLNFRIFTLQEMLAKGNEWLRKDWAMARLGNTFSERVPASAHRELGRIMVEVGDYTNEYNLFVDKIRICGEQVIKGASKLISHWGLRDHIKALYAEPDSLEAQRTLYWVMDSIVRQTIPRNVINNPNVEWDPFAGTGEREPDTRYEHLLKIFRAIKKTDKYYRTDKTLIARRFNRSREIPEETVEGWLTEFLSSPVAKRAGEFVSQKLGRSLEPFDIWFNNFVPSREVKELDALVAEQYPTLDALQTGEAGILVKLGFDHQTAREAASKIVIDPARSAGHATKAERREGVHRLRVRFLKEGEKYVPNFSTFNVFMHEFGHGVEMFFSTHRMDHNLLSGVPNTAFTEALAFVFQGRDMEVLGLESSNEELKALTDLKLFWKTFEIAGVALVDMRIWRWMYDHPDAKPADLRDAVVDIANGVWNEYFVPIYGVKDQPILAVYSHIISSIMYIPDYFIGSLIQHQIQEYLKGKNLARVIEKMYTLGNLVPDVWMMQAVGSQISPRPLIESAEDALEMLLK
jgi:hypothetical protein